MLLDKTEPNQIIFNLIECQLHLHVNLNAKSYWSNLDKWWISTRIDYHPSTKTISTNQALYSPHESFRRLFSVSNKLDNNLLNEESYKAMHTVDLLHLLSTCCKEN